MAGAVGRTVGGGVLGLAGAVAEQPDKLLSAHPQHSAPGCGGTNGVLTAQPQVSVAGLYACPQDFAGRGIVAGS